MRTHKWLVLLGLMVVFGMASATVFVRTTAAAYCGACEPLFGVPGVLQRVGFIPGGNCKHYVTNKKCVPQQCEVSGRKGFCKTRIMRDGDEKDRYVCFCSPYKVSR